MNLLLSTLLILLQSLIGIKCVENTSHAATLFDDTTESPNHYRIPALVSTKDGNLLAITDLRINGTGDIGWNAIDIVARRSKDCGKTWSKEYTIVRGQGEDFDYAHGDAAVVADRETGKIILLAASGKRGYPSNGVLLGQYFSTDNGLTWSGKDITLQIKEAFTKANLNVARQFFTSGRIIQSSKIKVGSHYRIYSSLCTGGGSIVMYSDDFGESWGVLGNEVAYGGGDETVLEELPNGDLLLSARLHGMGRGFTLYNYSNLKAGIGSWNANASLGINEATNCNGEMLLVPTKKKHIYALLHSVALSGRTNVSIYYKLIDDRTNDYTSPSFYEGEWQFLHQVSTTTSAYSTMVLDAKNNVAFLLEEDNTAGGYDINFHSYKIKH